MSARTTEPDKAIAALRNGAHRLVTMPVEERQRLLRACVAGVAANWESWVGAAWTAKRISAGEAARAEDIMTGPLPTLRYLRLLDQTLNDLTVHGQPQLPGKPHLSRGHWRVPVFPTRQLFDRLLFGPIQAEVRMPLSVTEQTLYGDNALRATGSLPGQPLVTLVLGAGNVSSIPITDALTKIFQDNQAVLLKMNPVNEYLGPIFADAFAPLIDADLLRIVYGGAEAGARWIAAPEIDRIHITGSDRTHDAIVWGRSAAEQADRKATNSPLLSKPITSELGNVSPWIVVPGKYSNRQLRFQAEHIVASVTNNASFNCIATKMLITCRDWPQRELLLAMIDDILASVPRRFAYYPGAADRYQRFAGVSANDPDRLPWTLRRNVNPTADSHLFQEESFVGVFAETTITAADPLSFLHQAVDFANEQMWGTLAAALTVPGDVQQRSADEIASAVDRLRYGTVGINLWPGVAFALMSTAWGAFPGANLRDIQSGVGLVHNTYLLDQPEQTVISAPLTIWPKPMWFSTHRCPEAVARRVIRLYLEPTLWRLPSVLLYALQG